MKKKEPQIHLDMNMFSDYRIMSLEDRFGHEGISVYIHLYFFLRMQPDYCHNCNELELLASRFNTTIEVLLEIICNFGLFRMAEDGTFCCIMLDEEMEIGERFLLPGKIVLLPMAENDVAETGNDRVEAEKTVAETGKNTLKTLGNESEINEKRPDLHTKSTENRPENTLLSTVAQGSGNNNNIINNYNNNTKKEVSSSRIRNGDCGNGNYGNGICGTGQSPPMPCRRIGC